MIKTALPFAWIMLLSGAVAPLPAQSLKEGFGFIPKDVARVEVYRDAATLDARFGATLGRLSPVPKTGIVDIFSGLELAPKDRPAGTVLLGAFDGDGKPGALGTRDAYWIPAKDFAGFARKVRAEKDKGLFKAKRKAGVYYLAKQGGFALVSLDKGLVQSIRKSKAFLGAEMEPLLPWISSHDLVMMAPAATVRKAFLKVGGELNSGKNPGAVALLPVLKPLLEKTGASVNQAALALDFPAGGSATFQARAFFTPQSPMAVAGAETPLGQGHPMDGLSPAGVVLGMGGPMPQALIQASSVFMGNLLRAGAATAEQKEQREKLVALQAEMALNIHGEAFTLGVPAGAGAPLLGPITWVIRVEDTAKFMQTSQAMKEAQASTLAAMGFKMTLEQDVLPGIPSFTQVLAYDGKGAPGTMIPSIQFKMALNLMLGSDRLSLSVGKVNDHTLMGVVGDAQVLKKAIAGYGTGFAQDPGVAATDALLPADAPWRLYLNLQNLRQMAQIIMDGIMPAQGHITLPAVPEVPPLGLAVRMDAQGIELDGAAARETMEALSAFIREANAMGKAPVNAAPSKK